VHGKQFAAWEAECLDRLVSLGNTRLALLVVDKRAEAPRVRPGPVRRVRSLLRSERILWFLYERLLVNGRVKALEPVDWSARLQGVAVLECDVSRRGRCSEYFSVSDIDIMRGHDLDFILRFAFGIVRAKSCRCPATGSGRSTMMTRYGTAVAPRRSGRSTVGIHRPARAAACHREARWWVILRKRAFATVLHSYTRNRDVGLFGCVAWPAEVSRDQLAGKDEYIDGTPSPSIAPISRAPSNREMLRFAVTLGRNYVRHCVRRRRSTSHPE
jgi:hypothetical protein